MKTRHHQYRLQIIATSLLTALASGLFAAGFGNAAWWFFGTLVVLVLIGILLTKYQAGGIARGAPTSAGDSLRRHWSMTILLFSICCTVSLCWLVFQRKPLPILDLGTSGLVMVLFSLISIGLVMYVVRLSLLSFPILFLGVTFLFTSSPLILYQIEGYEAFRWWKLVNLENVQKAMPVVMLAFSSFLVGSLIAVTKHFKRYSAKPGKIVHTHSDRLREVGLILYFLSIAIIVIMSFRGSGLRHAFEEGYRGYAGTRKADEMPRVVIASMAWFLPWSLQILAATSQNRRSYIHVWLLAVPACGLMFMAGDRTAPLAIILLLASSGYLLGFSMDWKRILVVVGLVAFLVPTIVNLRGIPIREWSWEALMKSVTNQVEGERVYGQSPIYATLTAMGTSYQTLMGTVMEVPDREPYRYGSDYLKSVAVAIPFFNPLFSSLGIKVLEDKPSQWLKARINPDGFSGQGYLQVAEAYLQFGAFGVIGLYLIFGWGLTRLWWFMSSTELDSRKLSLVLIVMMVILAWIRNDSSGVIRTFSWGWVLVYVSPIILRKLRKLIKPTDKQVITAKARTHA